MKKSEMFLKQKLYLNCSCGGFLRKIQKTEAGGKVYRAEISCLYKCDKCEAIRRTCYITHNPYYENNIKTEDLGHPELLEGGK